MNNHHAVLLRVASPKSWQKPEYTDAVSVSEFRSDKLGIDQVRHLIEQAYRRPTGLATEQKIIIVTEFITVEAQQALLKIVEEPPVATGFIFVIPTSHFLLDTLESRFETTFEKAAVCEDKEFSTFMDADTATKLKQIEAATKEKNEAWMTAIKCGLVEYLTKRATTFSALELTTLEFISRTLLTRGASNKMLLEQLALTLEARSQA